MPDFYSIAENRSLKEMMLSIFQFTFSFVIDRLT
jgi:hypothetical protein